MDLKPGEVICDKCDGSGRYKWEACYYHTCEKCGGLGKLDWIEVVVGKKSTNSFKLYDFKMPYLLNYSKHSLINMNNAS